MKAISKPVLLITLVTQLCFVTNVCAQFNAMYVTPPPPAPGVANPDLLCLPAVGADPDNHWLMQRWPEWQLASSDFLNIEAAKRQLTSQQQAISEESLVELKKAVQTDPVRRYEYAPYLLAVLFEALVAENPNRQQAYFKGAFEHYQACENHYRAVATLREWNQYQGRPTSVSAPPFRTATLSDLIRNHGPAVSGFMQSDSVHFGQRGGEAVAQLYLPMLAKLGLLGDRGFSGSLAMLGHNMTNTGNSVWGGVGAGVAGGAVVAGFAALSLRMVLAAKIDQARRAIGNLLGRARQTLDLAETNLKWAEDMAQTATQNLEAAQASGASAEEIAVLEARRTAALQNIQERQLAVAEAEKPIELYEGNIEAVAETTSAKWGVTLESMALPLLIASIAATILGMEVAEVNRQADMTKRLKEAVNKVEFKVGDILNGPAEEATGRRIALFTLLVKWVIAKPAEAGDLVLQMPLLPGGYQIEVVGIEKVLTYSNARGRNEIIGKPIDELKEGEQFIFQRLPQHDAYRIWAMPEGKFLRISDSGLVTTAEQIVDDRSMFRMSLQENGNYRIQAAFDGADLTFLGGVLQKYSRSDQPVPYLGTFLPVLIDVNPTRANYGRGVGTIPTNIATKACSAGRQYEAGLCYVPCAAGYSGAGPFCMSGWN